MKSFYEIKDRNGNHICFQVAKNESDAVYAAKNYYGHNHAATQVLAAPEKIIFYPGLKDAQ